MPYTIEKEGVYFYDHLLRDADPASFEILSAHFARDAGAVYVDRKRFAEGDPSSFAILLEREHHPTRFAHDSRYVYRTNLPAIIKGLNGASFRLLDRHYGCDDASVYSFDAVRVLKNVAPKHFTALEEGYAVAGNIVFFRGQKIAGADAPTFRVIGPSLGADSKAVFWETFKEPTLDPARTERIGGNYYRSAERVLYGTSPMEVVDPASLVVLADDYARTTHTVFFCSKAIPEADATTFVPLGAGYSKDSQRVYFNHRSIAGADAPSFQVRQGEASDRFRVYDGPIGTDLVAPTVGPGGSPESMETLARRLTDKRIQVLFPVFDAVQSNDSSEAIRDAFSGERGPAPVPYPIEFTLTVNGASLTIESGGFVLVGSFAAYLAAIGGLWGIATNKVLGTTPCIRLIDERDVMMPKGDLLIEETTLQTLPELFDVCSGLAQSGQLEECELIAYQLDKAVARLRYTPEGPPIVLRLKQLLSIHNLDIQGKSTLQRVHATTPPAVLKKLGSSPYLSSSAALERVVVAETFHQALGEAGSGDFLRFNKLAAPFLSLLQDPHPLVRDLMWQNLDFLVSRLFYAHAYHACLEHLPLLIAQGINLDINLARRWECLRATERIEEAERDWDALSSITSDRDRAPRQHAGFHTDYPNYDFWQAAGLLRLAAAYRSRAEGKDTGEDASLAVAAKKIAAFAETYNAFVIGPVLAELLVDLNELTKSWSYGKADYHMHAQYVEHVLTKRPYELEKVEARRSGLYQADRGRFFDLVTPANQVMPVLGQSYGIEYRLAGAPLSRTVPTRIRVYRQREAEAAKERTVLATYESYSYVGMDNAFYWTFDKEEELAPALWTIELEIDPAGPLPLGLAHRFEITRREEPPASASG